MERKHTITFDYDSVYIWTIDNTKPMNKFDVRWSVEHREVYEFMHDVAEYFPDLDIKLFMVIRDFFIHKKEEFLKNR